MQTKIINPWEWQNSLGFAQAVEVKNYESVLYCSGQAAMTAQGQPEGGSMEAQIKLCLENLEIVIGKAGYSGKGIVRVNIYTTSIPDFFQSYGIFATWLHMQGVTPSCTLVEVSALAFPELKVEFEATVIK